MSDWYRRGGEPRYDRDVEWNDRDVWREDRDNSARGVREARTFTDAYDSGRRRPRDNDPYAASNDERGRCGPARGLDRRNGYRPNPADLSPGYRGPLQGDRAHNPSDHSYDEALARHGSDAFGGHNTTVERISDGEYDRGHFFGGGMSRPAGEHRGRGPKSYTRSDERIRDDIHDRLSDDSWLDATEIEVSVTNGEVNLAGTVSNREDKRRAEDIADAVLGVKHVQNNLRLQNRLPAAHDPSAATAARRSSGFTE